MTQKNALNPFFEKNIKILKFIITFFFKNFQSPYLKIFYGLTDFFFQRLFWNFEKWTKKMSKNGNSKKVFEKT